jgi:hypothetical protein
MDFFVLETGVDLAKSEAPTYFHQLKPVNRGEAPRCRACGRFIGMLSWLPPYRVELQVWAEQAGDLGSGGGDDLLISERLKRCIEESGVRGFVGFDPVAIERIKSHKRGRRVRVVPPPYYRVGVQRSEAAIDIARSELEGEEPIRCPVCLDVGIIKRAKRIVLQPSPTPEEDVFRPRGLNLVLCSDRFRRCCAANRISNVILIPAQDYGFDFYPGE